MAEACKEPTEAHQEAEGDKGEAKKQDKGCNAQTVHHNSERTS